MIKVLLTRVYLVISYTPAVSEVLKFAWIQYMSFFFVVAFLLYRLNAFIFRHRVGCVIYFSFKG